MNTKLKNRKKKMQEVITRKEQAMDARIDDDPSTLESAIAYFFPLFYFLFESSFFLVDECSCRDRKRRSTA